MTHNSLRNAFFSIYGEKAYTGFISNGEYEMKNKYAHFVEDSMINVIRFIANNDLYKNENYEWENTDGVICSTDEELIVFVHELENKI